MDTTNCGQVDIKDFTRVCGELLIATTFPREVLHFILRETVTDVFFVARGFHLLMLKLSISAPPRNTPLPPNGCSLFPAAHELSSPFSGDCQLQLHRNGRFQGSLSPFTITTASHVGLQRIFGTQIPPWLENDGWPLQSESLGTQLRINCLQTRLSGTGELFRMLVEKISHLEVTGLEGL